MEPGPVSYQIAVSSAVLQDREDFFSVERCNTPQNDPVSVQDSTPISKPVSEGRHAVNINRGRRISTLTFDPSRMSKSFIKEEIKDIPLLPTEDYSVENNDEKQYWCALCQQNFNCHISLQVHMKIHAVKNEHTYSEECTSYGNDNSPDIYKGDKPFQCSVCDKKFYTRFNLGVHLKVHAGETPFRCNWCEKRFTHGRNLHKHIKSAHKGDDVNAASLCAKLLQANNSFENRLVIYTGEGEKPYKCSVCSKTFRRLYRVKEHTRTHSGQKPFQCSMCSKTFSSSDILYRHIKRIHNGGNPLQKVTKVENELPKPTIIHVEGPLTIPVQDIQQAMQDIQQEVNFLNAPRRHEIVNGDSRIVENSVNAPTYYIDLRPDVNTEEFVLQQESSERAFQCSLCGKTFNSSTLLNKHIVIHKIQVPVKCPVCFKTFKTDSYLRRHLNIHSGEKPFKCSLCPKAFYRQYRLSNHWRTHTGERPYQCSVCGKSFTVSDNMYRHIKKMHKGEGLQYAADLVKKIQEQNREKKYSSSG